MSAPAFAPASRPPQKRRKFTHEHSTKLTSSTNKGTSTATLKKKVRDLERLLAHQTKLPADVRLDNERALEAFKYELGLAKKSAKDERIDKKYQMVRFFERQKATRKLKQLQKQVAADSSPSESLQDDLHAAEVDLNYVIYYPKGEKYISLFKDPGEQTKVLEKRNMIRKDIERQMIQKILGKGVAANLMDVDGDGDGDEEVTGKWKGKGKEKLERAKQNEEKRTKENIKNKKRKEDVEKVPAEGHGNDGDGDDDDGFFEF